MDEIQVQKYEREPGSSLSHLIAVVGAIVATIFLILRASAEATTAHIVGYSIFGAGMILLYLSSTLYHFFHLDSRARRVFQRLDHGMIFTLIAASYTPICIVFPSAGWGWSMFGVIWALCLTGLLGTLIFGQLPAYVAIPLYILSGWLILLVFFPILFALPPWGIFYLALGGVLYTVGVIFYGLDTFFPRKNKWFGMHEIFHLFVMLGSASHVWFMYEYLIQVGI